MPASELGRADTIRVCRKWGITEGTGVRCRVAPYDPAASIAAASRRVPDMTGVPESRGLGQSPQAGQEGRQGIAR